MKYAAVETPEITDANAKKATGKTLKEWWKIIDAEGGLDVGRRDMTQRLYDKHGLKDFWWLTSVAVEYEIAKGQKEKDGRPKGYGVCATKTIGASAETVFEAVADGATWKKWFGTKAKADVKEGGKYSSGDGDAGTFGKVRAPKAIKMSWENPRHADTVVEWTFQPKGDAKTTVMVNHNRIQTRAAAEELREAWSAALDELKKLVEG